MPHICSSPHLTGLFPPPQSALSETPSLSVPVTLCRLSLQEARAERDHQGQASITGSPSPPPGTRLQVQARQDTLLWTAYALNVAKGKSVTQRKRKEK